MGKHYEFGGFVLDAATRELVRGGERQTLAPKLFDCLVWLIEHRDRAVGRDELIAAVWGQVDADTNLLAQVVARLRRMLDAAGGDSAIRTVPRFGYRWAMPTRVHEHAPDVADPPPAAPRRSIVRYWRRLRAIAAMLPLALVASVPLPRADAPIVSTQPVVIAPAAEAAPTPGSPEHRYRQAWNQFLAGRLDDAARDFTAQLGDTSAADAPVLRARVLNGLANVQYQQGDYDAQRRSADEAIALLDGRDAPVELGRALMGRAVAQVQRGEIDAARRDMQLARVALESGGDRLGMARAELALGVVLKRLGRYAEARAAFTGALTNLAMLPDVHDELVACVHLVETHLQLLEPADALALEPRLAALIARAPASSARRLGQITQIELLAANGRLRDARALLAGPMLADTCTGAPGACAAEPWRLQLAAARVRLGDDAAVELDTALRQPQSGPSGRDAGRAWLALLRRHLDRRDATEAERVLARMQAWADADEAVETPVYQSLARAEAAAARGDGVAARRAFARALAGADANLVPADLLEVAQSYVAWLLAAHDRAEAGVVAGRLALWARADFDAALVQLRVQHAIGRLPAWDAALRRARALAGERAIPAALTHRPNADALALVAP